MNTLLHIKLSLGCIDACESLSISEEILTNNDNFIDNCGVMSPSTKSKDILRADNKILNYINSLKGKQRTVTSAQISKELGMSQEFIELILTANGFEED